MQVSVCENTVIGIKISKNSNFIVLDYRYHVPEERLKNIKDSKIVYLDKNKLLKNYNVIKAIATYGKVIKNNYNKL